MQTNTDLATMLLEETLVNIDQYRLNDNESDMEIVNIIEQLLISSLSNYYEASRKLLGEWRGE